MDNHYYETNQSTGVKRKRAVRKGLSKEVVVKLIAGNSHVKIGGGSSGQRAQELQNSKVVEFLLGGLEFSV